MKSVLTPCAVEKNSMAVPSQMWYLIEASNGSPSTRNNDIPLRVGSSIKTKQASAKEPNLVATFMYLNCHLCNRKKLIQLIMMN